MRRGRPSYVVKARWIIDNYNDRLPPGVRANDVAITNNYNRSYNLSTTPLIEQESDTGIMQEYRAGVQDVIANDQYRQEWNEIGRHHINLIYDNNWRDESPLDEPKNLAAPPLVPLNPRI